MTQPAKGKDFGLAAQLARPRPPTNATPKIVEEEVQRSQEEVPIATLAPALLPAASAQVSSAAPRRPPGRPRRTENTNRMTLVLSVELSEYLNSAWRTHRCTNGKYVNGPSAFIEELLRAHRQTSG
jgi:hypothetical protein